MLKRSSIVHEVGLPMLMSISEIKVYLGYVKRLHGKPRGPRKKVDLMRIAEGSNS